jgi:hypothetical protein
MCAVSSYPNNSAVVFFMPFDECFSCVDQHNIEGALACSNGLASRQAKGLAFGQRVSAPFDVAVGCAFAGPARLADVKIGPVLRQYSSIIKSRSSMLSVLGLPPAAFCTLLAAKSNAAMGFKRVPLNPSKPTERLALQLFNRICRPPLPATTQTIVKRRLCKRSNDAIALQQPLPNEFLQIVARGEKSDQARVSE